MSAPRLLAPAARELRTAMRWYEEQRPGLGSDFLGAVHQALSRVGATPEQFAPWPDHPRFRRGLTARFPYAIFCHVVDDEPIVVAVAHTSRRPGYWLNRTQKSEEDP